jgi:hypothetical protein
LAIIETNVKVIQQYRYSIPENVSTSLEVTNALQSIKQGQIRWRVAEEYLSRRW